MAAPSEKKAIVNLNKGLSPQEKAGCMVRPCPDCKPAVPNSSAAEYQDQKYTIPQKSSVPLRVKNFSKAKGWACTICTRYEGQAIAKK